MSRPAASRQSVRALRSVAQAAESDSTVWHRLAAARSATSQRSRQRTRSHAGERRAAGILRCDQLPALDERGSAVEQFRSLRSRMQEFRDLNTLKSIMVSSGLPQEGKSFVAANLAISFARHKAGARPADRRRHAARYAA